MEKVILLVLLSACTLESHAGIMKRSTNRGFCLAEWEKPKHVVDATELSRKVADLKTEIAVNLKVLLQELNRTTLVASWHAHHIQWHFEEELPAFNPNNSESQIHRDIQKFIFIGRFIMGFIKAQNCPSHEDIRRDLANFDRRMIFALCQLQTVMNTNATQEKPAYEELLLSEREELLKPLDSSIEQYLKPLSSSVLKRGIRYLSGLINWLKTEE